jgi:hypothetical protein
MPQDLTFVPYGSPETPSRRGRPGASGLPFTSGLVLGLLVLPLTALFVAFLDGSAAVGFPAFLALTVGAASLPPTSGRRVAGVVTGIALEVAGGAGVVVWYLATHEIRLG